MRTIIVGAMLALASAVAARADEPLPPPPGPTLLLVPVAAGEGLAWPELAKAVTDGLATTITEIPPWEVVRFDPKADVFARVGEEILAHPSAPDSVIALSAAAGAAASLVGDLATEDMVVTAHLDLRAAERTVVRSATARATVNAPEGEMPAALREAAAGLLVKSVMDRLRPALERIADGQTGPVDYAIDQHIAAGRARLSAGDHELAVEEFEAALAIDPRCGSCYMALADAHIAAGRHSDAIDALRQALYYQPGDVAARITLATCYQQVDQADEAITQYLAVLARQPGYLFARIRLARLYADLGRDASAIDQYQQVVAADPGNVGARLALADLALDVDRRELALAQLEGLDSIDPRDTETAAQLARRLIDEAESSQGIMLLALVFATQEEKATYEDAEYGVLAAALDLEATAIDREGRERGRACQAGNIDRQTLLADAEALHTRSSRLAAVAEHITPPDKLDGDHAKRVLAYRLLNQSDYELMRYAREGADDAFSRVIMLRQSAQETLPK